MKQKFIMIGCHLLGLGLLVASFYVDHILGDLIAGLALLVFVFAFKFIPSVEDTFSNGRGKKDHAFLSRRSQKREYDLY